ncbi:MAG: cytochrome c3 family protein [bacterium]
MASRQEGGVNCFKCHGRPSLTKKFAKGKEISLFVDKAGVMVSVHKKLDCVDCHVDATSIPHKEALSRVDCSACHAESKV